MNEIIKITETNGKQAVSARELHTFLESKQQFADWIKDRIGRYEFVENQDFEVIHNFMKNPNGGRPMIEYALTVDAAKELSMVEGNERGKQARRYFIECEKKLKTGDYNLPTTYSEALRLAAEQAEKIESQQKQLQDARPSITFTAAVSGSKSSCLIGELAKIITQNGYPIGQNRLFAWMRDNGYLGTQGDRYNIPNQRYVEQGLFEVKKGVRSGSDGVMHTTITTKVMGKGQIYFVNKFMDNLITA